MTQKQSIEKYKEYLTGHIGNVAKALEVLATLDIPYVTEHIDELREIVKEHDASKYEEPEWSAYLHHFYPTNDEEAMMEEEFENACRHHIRANKHHWNYWCDEDNNLIEDIDEEEYKLYTIERICDWLSMAAQHDEGPTEYWNANKDYIVQPDYARELCDEIFPKIPEDFGKDMWKITRGELDESLKEDLYMNRDVVDSLGKRVKRSKTSNTIEIDTSMTNHDRQLKEEDRIPKKYSKYVKCMYLAGDGTYMIELKDNYETDYGTTYIQGNNKKEAIEELELFIEAQERLDESILTEPLDEYGNSGYVGQSKSVRAYEAEDNDRYTATECDKLLGVRSGATKACLVPSEWHHTGSYYKETDYYDIRLLLAIKDNDEEVISEYDEDEIKKAKENLEELKSWRKPKLTSNTYKADVEWLTWSGTRKHPKATKHSVKNADVEERGSYYYFNDEYGIPTKKMIGSNGTYVHKLDESVLNEMKLSQIKQKSKNQDPERISRSRKVKSTYLGMSKFGILNFKTTSQSRNGHHYQTIEFKDMKPFEDIVKAGKEIMPLDVKAQLQNQDVNVWCTDESFAFWAWAHQAYKNDFLYMDDRIPNLKKAIQAPKVNNVRLNGGACKHILSVIDYVMKPFVLLAISEDMNKFLAGNKEDKFSKQSVATQNQYDMVAQWDWSDIEEITGKSKIEIMSDISKTLQIIPDTDKGDIITDIVGEVLPQEDQGLKRQIVDRIEDLIDNEDTNKNS